MNIQLFEEHAQASHWDLWQLGMQHMRETWPQWTEEVLPCVWCAGSLNLARGPVKLHSHRCQLLAALALAIAYHSRELEPMGSIFDLRLKPSERIQWATRLFKRPCRRLRIQRCMRRPAKAQRPLVLS